MLPNSADEIALSNTVGIETEPVHIPVDSNVITNTEHAKLRPN